jgi:hypothetical protein
MAILFYAETLEPKHELNKAIDDYNLTPHDNYPIRQEKLNAVINIFSSLDNDTQDELNPWVTERLTAHLLECKLTLPNESSYSNSKPTRS